MFPQPRGCRFLHAELCFFCLVVANLKKKKDITVHQNAALLVRSDVHANNRLGYSSVSRSDLEGFTHT